MLEILKQDARRLLFPKWLESELIDEREITSEIKMILFEQKSYS